MKKVLFFALAFVIVSQAVKAQTGSILVGGSINFSSTKTPSTPNNTKYTSFDFNPTVGYQFSDNWTAGVVADIGSGKNTNAAGVSVKENIFNVGPFLRYAKSLSDIFAIYGQVQGVFGTDKIGSAKSTTAGISAFPAVFINVKNGFGLNFSVGGISYGSSKPSGGSASNTFAFTFGKSVGIGLSKNFGGSKKK